MLTDFIIWFRDHIPVLRFIFIALGLAFFAVALYLNAVLGLTKEKVDHWIDVIGAKDISKRNQLKMWKGIRDDVEKNTPASLRAAVVAADRILEEILKVAGFPGPTLNEKIENATEEQIPNIQELREAHNFTNNIARNSSLVLTQGEARNAIRIYARTFLDLGLLENED